MILNKEAAICIAESLVSEFLTATKSLRRDILDDIMFLYDDVTWKRDAFY